LSRKGANGPARGRKLRSTGTKAKARVSNEPYSLVELKMQLEERTRELAEAREQQAETAEILRIISTSPTELPSVLEVVAECRALLQGRRGYHFRAPRAGALCDRPLGCDSTSYRPSITLRAWARRGPHHS